LEGKESTNPTNLYRGQSPKPVTYPDELRNAEKVSGQKSTTTEKSLSQIPEKTSNHLQLERTEQKSMAGRRFFPPQWKHHPLSVNPRWLSNIILRKSPLSN